MDFGETITQRAVCYMSIFPVTLLASVLGALAARMLDLTRPHGRERML